MSRSITVLFFILSLAILSSCKKHTTTLQVELMYIPNDLDSLFSTRAYTATPTTVTDVSGVLIANDLSGTLMDTAGNMNLYQRRWEAALFSNTRSTELTSVGIVSVNSVPLQIPFLNQAYAHYDTAAVWQENAINHWQVSGAGDIAAFNAEINGVFPSYTATLPTSISKSQDFTLAFNASNTLNGDRAYVILYYYGVKYTSDIVSTNGGSIIFPAGFLSRMENNYFSIPASTGWPIYYGGLICVVVYSQSIQTINGKKYSFVKQKEVLGVVTFL